MDPPRCQPGPIPVMAMGFCLLLTDFLIYSIFVPLIGASFAAALAQSLDVSGLYEIYLVILAVTGMFYLMFNGFRCLGLESIFWRKLFAGEKGYLAVLMARDIVNIYTLYCSVRMLYYGLLGSSETQGIGLKTVNLGEGIGFVFWNGMAERGLTVPGYIQDNYPWTPEVQKSSFWFWNVGAPSLSDQNLKNIQMINAAKLVLGIAGITAFVMKLSYFSVLHTYVRAMNIFTAMQDQSPPQSRAGLTDSIHSAVSESVTFSFNAKDIKANNPPRPTRSNTAETIHN